MAVTTDEPGDVSERDGTDPIAAAIATAVVDDGPVDGNAVSTVQRLDHMPALDGMRGLFVILGPMMYHFAPAFIPGGMFSLDFFFVMSSFLIVSLALNEWDRTGRFDAGAYAARRARRLMPALMVCFVVVAFATAFLISAAQISKWTAGTTAGMARLREVEAAGQVKVHVAASRSVRTARASARSSYPMGSAQNRSVVAPSSASMSSARSITAPTLAKRYSPWIAPSRSALSHPCSTPNRAAAMGSQSMPTVESRMAILVASRTPAAAKRCTRRGAYQPNSAEYAPPSYRKRLASHAPTRKRSAPVHDRAPRCWTCRSRPEPLTCSLSERIWINVHLVKGAPGSPRVIDGPRIESGRPRASAAPLDLVDPPNPRIGG